MSSFLPEHPAAAEDVRSSALIGAFTGLVAVAAPLIAIDAFQSSSIHPLNVVTGAIVSGAAVYGSARVALNNSTKGALAGMFAGAAVVGLAAYNSAAPVLQQLTP